MHSTFLKLSGSGGGPLNRFYNKLSKLSSVFVWGCLLFPSIHLMAQNTSSAGSHLFSSSDTAAVPSEIQDPECLGINKEPYHATLMPYKTTTEALNANRMASSYALSLNGIWKFNWVDWPQKRPVDFYKEDYDVSKWADIPVPSNWQVQGYGTPNYSNYNYIFQKDFPNVMSTPPVSFTTYEKRNPVGSYRRVFELPDNWDGREIFVTFDGVDAGFFLWVNGKKVGYSVNSRNAAEFNLTKFVHPGKNMIAVEVYRFTTGSYLEDQDMWRLSGIFRNVTLWSSPKVHVRDFFIKTKLDKNYQNATLDLTATVKNYSDNQMSSRKLSLSLFEGDILVKGVNATIDVPQLAPGEEVQLHSTVSVNRPKKWTAETPILYTSVLRLSTKEKSDKNSKTDGGNGEILSARTGFRDIKIQGRELLVNGVPIKLKGVNRHENWPDDGHAVTEAQMIRDIELIKQANCNHVRTCHYSDDPRWYELCDQYGLYLVAEANLECHGAWDEFNEDPRIKAAIIDRNVANVENFKNHPSVIIWSLGNECGSGGTNFRAALSKIREIDPTRPTHYQGFGIGDKNPADIDSEMYTSIDGVENHAKDKTLTKPFYLCEYAHAMFNSMGSVDLYNDLFDKYPALLGGAIWEWQDQGIYNNRDPKHPITAYGGGFGEVPNDHYFIHKGVVFSDRSPKPHYPELKHAYQWVTIKLKDTSKQLITIKNRYQFTNLDQLTATWSVAEDGKQIASGPLNIGNLEPGNEKEIKVPYQLEPIPGKEYFVRVAFQLSKNELWAKKGYEVASQQFELGILKQPINRLISGQLKVHEDDQNITVNGPDFGLTLDKKLGVFTQMQSHGEDLLEADAKGPYLHLWRAPHRKDDMWAYPEWQKYGLDDLRWSASDVNVTEIGAGKIKLDVMLLGKGKRDFTVTHHVIYTVTANGKLTVENQVHFSKQDIPLGRLGIRLFLNKKLDNVEYLGRGPMENYADRKSGFDIGDYSSSVMEQMTGYEKPMDCGNHEDVRWVCLTGKALHNGYGLKAFHVGEDYLQFTALPYSDEQMTPVEYKIDLPKSNATVLVIAHKTLGVGSYGCGPKPLDRFIPNSQDASFSYGLDLVNPVK